MKVLLNQTVNLVNSNSTKNNAIKNKIENEKTEINIDLGGAWLRMEIASSGQPEYY